jgi:hypothetical protein
LDYKFKPTNQQRKRLTRSELQLLEEAFNLKYNAPVPGPKAQPSDAFKIKVKKTAKGEVSITEKVKRTGKKRLWLPEAEFQRMLKLERQERDKLRREAEAERKKNKPAPRKAQPITCTCHVVPCRCGPKPKAAKPVSKPKPEPTPKAVSSKLSAPVMPKPPKRCGSCGFGVLSHAYPSAQLEGATQCYKCESTTFWGQAYQKAAAKHAEAAKAAAVAEKTQPEVVASPPGPKPKPKLALHRCESVNIPPWFEYQYHVNEVTGTQSAPSVAGSGKSSTKSRRERRKKLARAKAAIKPEILRTDQVVTTVGEASESGVSEGEDSVFLDGSDTLRLMPSMYAYHPNGSLATAYQTVDEPDLCSVSQAGETSATIDDVLQDTLLVDSELAEAVLATRDTSVGPDPEPVSVGVQVQAEPTTAEISVATEEPVAKANMATQANSNVWEDEEEERVLKDINLRLSRMMAAAKASGKIELTSYEKLGFDPTPVLDWELGKGSTYTDLPEPPPDTAEGEPTVDKPRRMENLAVDTTAVNSTGEPPSGYMYTERRGPAHVTSTSVLGVDLKGMFGRGERKRLRTNLEVQDPELESYLRLEMLGQSSTPAHIQVLTRKAKAWLKLNKPEVTKTQDIYQRTVTAVSAALVPDEHVEHLRQWLKSDQNNTVIHNNARMVKGGNLGKRGFLGALGLGKSTMLPGVASTPP